MDARVIEVKEYGVDNVVLAQFSFVRHPQTRLVVMLLRSARTIMYSTCRTICLTMGMAQTTSRNKVVIS
jgi:hypothetical protein